MENEIELKKKFKGINSFNVLYFIGVIVMAHKMLDYLHWTFLLIRKWSMPEEPFFSQVDISQSDVHISLVVYLIFAIAYIVAFAFVLIGLYQLDKSVKLLSQNQIFLKEISEDFKKAGTSFLIFPFGTFAIDVVLLFWTRTSSRVVDLFSTEKILFLILGYLLFFLSDIFSEGVIIKEENELTI